MFYKAARDKTEKVEIKFITGCRYDLIQQWTRSILVLGLSTCRWTGQRVRHQQTVPSWPTCSPYARPNLIASSAGRRCGWSPRGSPPSVHPQRPVTSACLQLRATVQHSREEKWRVSTYCKKNPGLHVQVSSMLHSSLWSSIGEVKSQIMLNEC